MTVHVRSASRFPVFATRRLRLNLFAVAITLGAACADEPAVNARAMDDSGATVDHGDGVWAEAGGAWTLDVDRGVAIGQVQGEDPYVFGRISGVVVDAAGRIHVADSQAREIRVFSPAGEFLRSVGRDGEGPGEFRYLSGLAVAPDGIAAMDGALSRVTVFGDDGEVVRMFRLVRPHTIQEGFATMAFDSRGRFFDRVRLSRTPGIDSIGVATYEPSGERAGTAFLADIRADHVAILRNGVPVSTMSRPFAPQPSITIGPDGTAYLARGDAYRIDLFSPAGSLRTIQRAVEPRPVTDRERELALESIAEFFEGQGEPIQTIDLPRRMPVIRGLEVDVGGNVWVRGESAGQEIAVVEWHVHDPEGRYLGVVTTPPMAVTQIGEDFLAGSMWDELGVQTAVVFPLVRDARP